MVASTGYEICWKALYTPLCHSLTPEVSGAAYLSVNCIYRVAETDMLICT